MKLIFFFPIITSGIFRKLLLIAVYLTAVTPLWPQFALPGTVDRNFTPALPPDLYITGVAPLPNGQVMVGGQRSLTNGHGVGVLLRLNRDGSVDRGFNAYFATRLDTQVDSMLLLPDGRVMVMGSFDWDGTPLSHLARVNADGSVDTTFYPRLNSLVSSGYFRRPMLLQPDGRLIVPILTVGPSGFAEIDPPLSIMELYRLNEDGTVDPSFHTWFDFRCGAVDGCGRGPIAAAALQRDGKILVSGGGSVGFYHVTGAPWSARSFRLDSDGALDKDFHPPFDGSDDERFLGRNFFFPVSLLPETDGDIVAALLGETTDASGVQGPIVRLAKDGQLKTVLSRGPVEAPWIFAFHPNGRIVVSDRRSVWRLNADGAPDPTFVRTSLLPTEAGWISGLIPEENGGVFITGSFTNISGGVAPGLARLNGDLPPAAASISELVTLGIDQSIFSDAKPEDLTNLVSVAYTDVHIVGLRRDGTVASWQGPEEVIQVPAGLSNVIAVAAGSYYSLALKANGTVVTWGAADFVLTNLPPDLTNVIAISSMGFTALALKSDGTIQAFRRGPMAEPSTGLSNVVAIAAGWQHSTALLANGTVVDWGDIVTYDEEGMLVAGHPPEDLTNVVAISAGPHYGLALKADGTVVSWGAYLEPLGGGGLATPPSGLSNVVSVAAGPLYSVALRADGSIVEWGLCCGWASFGAFSTNINLGVSNILSISAGQNAPLALIGDASEQLHSTIGHPSYDSAGFKVSVPTVSGRVYRLEFKDSLEESAWHGLPLVAGSGRNIMMNDARATSAHRFYRVRQW